MFSNQLAILSLLLVGLGLSSNLSEAAYDTRELFEMLPYVTDHNVIHYIFVRLGGPYQAYANLRDVKEENCTPERILFDERIARILGPGVQNYVRKFVDEQRLLCEQTFINRLINKYAIFLGDWPRKDSFQQFSNFVEPRPTLATNRNEMTNIVENVEKYIEWRKSQSPRLVSERVIRSALYQSCVFVNDLLGNFLASLKTGRPFHPPLSLELQEAIALAKIADAVVFFWPAIH